MSHLINRETALTWPNAISLVGFTLVIIEAARLDTWLGLGLVAAGRLADLFDGRLARSTHHVSRFGALLDATLDKLATLAIIIALWAKDLAPEWALIAIIAQNALNGIATLLATRFSPKRSLTPSRAGKYAMATQNLALGLFALSNLVDRPDAVSGIFLFIAACIATFMGVAIFGLWATTGYIRRVRA